MSATRQVDSVDYDWVPDPQTGLSGDAYLLEELESYVTDVADAQEPGVYTLELSIPDTTDYSVYSELWKSHSESIPPYLEVIADSPCLFYVGAAKNVAERIRTHLDSPNQSTTIASVFPIHSIEQIEWFDSPGQAFEREHGLAMEYEQTLPGYVHCR